MIVKLIPNVICTAKYPTGFENKYQNCFMEILEQIGRFGCFGFMVINILYLKMHI